MADSLTFQKGTGLPPWMNQSAEGLFGQARNTNQMKFVKRKKQTEGLHSIIRKCDTKPRPALGVLKPALPLCPPRGLHHLRVQAPSQGSLNCPVEPLTHQLGARVHRQAYVTTQCCGRGSHTTPRSVCTEALVARRLCASHLLPPKRYLPCSVWGSSPKRRNFPLKQSPEHSPPLHTSSLSFPQVFPPSLDVL